MSKENQLGDYLLQHQNEIPLFQSYPYVITREYYVFPPHSQYGSGDFVFANSTGKFLVVEIKFLHTGVGRNAKCKRRRQRRKVEKQAKYYATVFKLQNPFVQVSYSPVTDKNFTHAQQHILHL